MTSSGGWSVVLPLKPLHQGKSRLRVPVPLRRALVLAMARDVRDAVLACDQVAEIVVVTADPGWHRLLGDPRLRFVADGPGDSLNDALGRGAAACRSARPGCAVAALTADVPALHPHELTFALGNPDAASTWFVPDALGSGTTLYAAGPHAPFRPRYGGMSRTRHLRDGAAELPMPTDAGIRQDVDTPDDLERVISLRLGRHTRAVLSSMEGERRRRPGNHVHSSAPLARPLRR